MTRRIIVVAGQNGKFRLRIYLGLDDMAREVFETGDVFTKREADFRAVMFSSHFGLDRDELPTHPATCLPPKEIE